MKCIYYLALLCVGLVSCEKGESGRIEGTLKCTSEQWSGTALKSAESDGFYTQFGDYITSVTPYHLSANFNFLFAQGDQYGLTFNQNSIDGGQDEQLIDFSANQEVSVIPTVSTIDTASNGEIYWLSVEHYDGSDITFTYFSFTPWYFYQELTLPPEYTNVTLKQFNQIYQIPRWGIGQQQFYCDSVKSGNILKTNWEPLIQQVENHPDIRYNFGYLEPDVFRYIKNDTSTFIRSSFTPITFTSPVEGEILELIATISFEIRDLIQIYAGDDNLPYTGDDILVYAPEYWKRMKVKMEIN